MSRRGEGQGDDRRDGPEGRDRYYRFTKITDTEGCPSADILAQVSPSLRATGDSGAWRIVDRCIGRRAGTPEVEGPTAFRANPGDTSGFRYFLWVDHYGGVGYIPLATHSLDGKIKWTIPRGFHLPRSPRHGTVMPITAAERDALVAHWNPVPSQAQSASLTDRWVVPRSWSRGHDCPCPMVMAFAGARMAGS